MNMSWELEEYDVIVLGSGMAGLGAAKVLSNEKMKYIVLEGRERAGGRVYTKSLPPVSGLGPMDVDLGANYLIGCSYRHNEQPLLGLAKDAKVETVTSAGDLIRKYGGWECPEVGMWKNYRTGDDIDMEMVVSMTHLVDMTVSMMSARYKRLSDKKKLVWNNKVAFNSCLDSLLKLYYQNGYRKSEELTEIEREIFDSLTTRLITYQSPLEQLPVDIFHDFASIRLTEKVLDGTARPTQVFEVTPMSQDDMNDWISMIFYRLKAIKDNPPQITTKINSNSEDRLVTNRFSNFIDYLKSDVPIQYNTIVKKIDYSSVDGSSILIHTVNSITKTVRVYKCNHCICTLPVGVLASLDARSTVEFVPELPQEKRESIQKLALPHKGAETHNKVVLRYHPDDVFWHPYAPHLKSNNSLIHILNFHCYGKPGLLVCHIWGGTGIKTIDHTDEEIVNRVLTILEGMYQKRSKKLPKPVQTLVTRWSEDPFSLGSYTPGGCDSTENDRDIYRAPIFVKQNLSPQPHSFTTAPENREVDVPVILFAGEATLGDIDAKECTHGALMSGMARAAELVQFNHPKYKVPIDNPYQYLKGKFAAAAASASSATTSLKRKSSSASTSSSTNMPAPKKYISSSTTASLILFANSPNSSDSSSPVGVDDSGDDVDNVTGDPDFVPPSKRNS